MKKIIALVAILGLICAQAQSASIITRDGYSAYAYGFMKKKNTVTSYTGPGDIVSGATAWYGLRGYNAAYSTGSNPAAIIRRASDNTTSTINILSSGAFDASTAATFCASTTCYITTLYDQTGNGNTLTQGTNANQPQIKFSCAGSLPCVLFVSANSTSLSDATFAGISQPITVATVAQESITTNSNNKIFQTTTAATSGNVGGLIRWSSATNLTMYLIATLEVSATVTSGALESIVGIWNGASMIMLVNNAINTGSGATNAWGTGLTLGAGTSVYADLYEMEFGVWAIAFNSTQYGNICHNQYTYWGTSVSC